MDHKKHHHGREGLWKILQWPTKWPAITSYQWQQQKLCPRLMWWRWRQYWTMGSQIFWHGRIIRYDSHWQWHSQKQRRKIRRRRRKRIRKRIWWWWLWRRSGDGWWELTATVRPRLWQTMLVGNRPRREASGRRIDRLEPTIGGKNTWH